MKNIFQLVRKKTCQIECLLKFKFQLYTFSKFTCQIEQKKEKRVISIHIYIQIKSVKIFYFNLVWLNIINQAQNSKMKTKIMRLSHHSHQFATPF